MKIYIASSWKNQHGVEMLTALLRDKGHEVVSWVENNYGETHNHVTKQFPFEEWVTGTEANQSFIFDTEGATKSDLCIYYAPSGKDACAEMGAAWASGVPILGLYAKGEDLGLMRKMVSRWFDRAVDLVKGVENLSQVLSETSTGIMAVEMFFCMSCKESGATKPLLRINDINVLPSLYQCQDCIKTESNKVLQEETFP